MGALNEVTESDFETVLERKGGVRSFQVLYTAFAGGVLAFLAVVIAIAVSRSPPLAEADPGEPAHFELLTILSAALAAQALICWGLAFWL